MCLKFEGKLSKANKYWAVSVQALDIYTQGKTKKDALDMIREAISLSMGLKKSFIKAQTIGNDRFVLSSRKTKDDKFLMALMLKNQRAKHGLSLREVADRLGVSKHAYAQYEQGRALPSIAKVEEYIRVMNKNAHVVLNILETA